MISKLTKLVQINDDKQKFIKFIFLLYKSVSMIKIRRTNLKRRNDFKIGLISNG